MATKKSAAAKKTRRATRQSENAPPRYVELNDVERILIYEFLDRIRDDVVFREAVVKDPQVVFSVATSRIPLAKLLRPNLLEVMGKLRRVALEEIGIDVAPYRDEIRDNGFKIRQDNKA